MTVAVIQFRQDRTVFGQDACFFVHVRHGQRVQVPGGTNTRHRVDEVGELVLRAEIQGYYSDWTTFSIEAGDIIDVMILPPEGRWLRAFALANKKNYLSIVETDRKRI